MTLYKGIPIEEIRRLPRPKLLLPNEHGAWTMLAVAFLAGWLGAPTLSWRPLLLVPAALGAFLVRYPIGIYFKKRRVTRALKIPLTREKNWTIIYGLFAVIAGVPLLYPLGWWWLIPVGVFASGVLTLHLWSIIKRKERTFLVEFSAMLGISILAPTAAQASLHPFRVEPWIFVMWLLLVAFNTWRVQAVRFAIAHKQERPVDIPGIGKREMWFSLFFLVLIVCLSRLVLFDS